MNSKNKAVLLVPALVFAFGITLSQLGIMSVGASPITSPITFPVVSPSPSSAPITFPVVSPTPAASSNPSGSNSGPSSDSGGGSSAPSCNDQKPGSAPVLISAVSKKPNEVVLTWTKAGNPVSYYLISYGTNVSANQYGNPNVGGSNATSYTVKGLSGNTTYFFRVRAGNGCIPGDFSNVLSVKPNGKSIAKPAEGFKPGVLSLNTSNNNGNTHLTQPKANQNTSQSNNQNVFQRLFGFFGSIFSH